MQKLLKEVHIREVQYPEWLANLVLVKKPNGKWHMCVDFMDFNKACLKDNHPLPSFETLVNDVSENEILSMMNGHSDHNQILMPTKDEENTSFITD